MVDGREFEIFFDESCVAIAGTPEELRRRSNVEVRSVLIGTVLGGLSDTLVRHLVWSLDKEDSLDEATRASAATLITTILRGALQAVNRLIAWIRGAKGQWWVQPFPMGYFSPSILVRYVRLEGEFEPGQWSRIDPYRIQIIDSRGGPPGRYVTEADWGDFTAWYASSRPPNLVGELLTNAEELAELGHRRTALVEAVTALEVAISRFATKQPSEELWRQASISRAAADSLSKHVAELGVRRTVAYLLPLLLHEELLPPELHEDLIAAIDRRNEIVHQGRRDMPQADLKKMLANIRHFATDTLREA